MYFFIDQKDKNEPTTMVFCWRKTMELYDSLVSLLPVYNLNNVTQNDLSSWIISINRLDSEHNKVIFILILHHYKLSLNNQNTPLTVQDFITNSNRLPYGIRKIDNVGLSNQSINGISIKSTIRIDWSNLPDMLIKIIIIYLMKYAFVNPPLKPGMNIKI